MFVAQLAFAPSKLHELSGLGYFINAIDRQLDADKLERLCRGSEGGKNQ
jgi:hypothetical protein